VTPVALLPLALLPVAVSIVGAFGARAAVGTLHPARATTLLCTVTASSAVAAAAALVLVASAAIEARFGAGAATMAPGEGSGWAGLLEWCGGVTDHRAPLWTGLAAGAALVLAAARLIAYRRRWQREIRPWRGASPVHVIAGASTEAFAVPGRPGVVVVGQGLLDGLEPDERRVVLAHERAHLTHRHHRYLQFSDAAAAAFPFLAPLAGHVRLATERWADEVAAAEVGDRPLVATAIIKAALAGSEPTLLPAVASGHVTVRVDALLHRGSSRWSRPWLARASLTSVGVTLVASSLQVHHLIAYVTHAATGHL
jgi:Zn-dependent protease with chaperone function